MAKLSTVYFTGPCLFAKVFESNRQPEDKYTPKGGQYQIMIGLDDDDFEMVEEWVPLYRAKTVKKLEKKNKKVPEAMDPDLNYITFKRNHAVYDEDGNEKRVNGAPEVVDLDGNPWEGGLIGNGSIVTVRLDKYDGEGNTGPYTKLTLDGIRIDEHVPYEGGNEIEEGETVDRSGGRPF